MPTSKRPGMGDVPAWYAADQLERSIVRTKPSSRDIDSLLGVTKTHKDSQHRVGYDWLTERGRARDRSVETYFSQLPDVEQESVRKPTKTHKGSNIKITKKPKQKKLKGNRRRRGPSPPSSSSSSSSSPSSSSSGDSESSSESEEGNVTHSRQKGDQNNWERSFMGRKVKKVKDKLSKERLEHFPDNKPKTNRTRVYD